MTWSHQTGIMFLFLQVLAMSSKDEHAHIDKLDQQTGESFRKWRSDIFALGEADRTGFTVAEALQRIDQHSAGGPVLPPAGGGGGIGADSRRALIAAHNARVKNGYNLIYKYTSNADYLAVFDQQFRADGPGATSSLNAGDISSTSTTRPHRPTLSLPACGADSCTLRGASERGPPRATTCCRRCMSVFVCQSAFATERFTADVRACCVRVRP